MGDEGRGHIKIGADFTDIVGMGAAISKALEDGRKGLRRGKTALLGYDTATNKAVATVKTLTEAGGLLTKHYTLATQKLVENSVASRTLTIKLDAQAKAQERLNTQMRSAYGSDVSRTRRLNLRAHAAGLKVIAERERALAAALRERIRLNLQAQRTGSRIIDARNRAQSGAILQDKQFNAQRDQRAFDQQLASEWKAPRQGVGLPTESRFKRALGSLRKWNTGLKTAQQTTSNLHISWKSLFRLVAVQLAHQAVSAFIRATVEGVRQSIELEKRIAEIQTISQNQPQPFGAWLRGLRELSDEFGLGIIDQAEAAYQTLSNQVAEGAASFRFMREANILAVTAVMSSADAVNLLTAAINSYHTTTLSANKIAAQFFKTIELGRVRGSEMAQSFGDVAVLANQLNVPLTELQAIIATMTIQGIKYNKAATQMRGIFVKLLKPTKEMKEFFKEIGVSSGEAAMAAYGFDGVMERLVKHTKGSSSELAKYISRIRGLSGTLVFNAEGMDLYKNNLLEIQSAQADYADRTAIVMDNAGKKLEIELNKIKNYFLVDFGDNILRTLAGVSGGFGNLTKIIKIAAFTFKSVLATAVIFALAQLVKLKAMLWSFASLNPMTAAVSLAVVALMFFYETWESASDRTNRIITENYEKNKKALEKMFTEEAELAAERETMLIDSFSKVQKAYILLFAEANMIINKIMKEHVNTFADATVLVNQNIKDSLAATKTHSAEVSKAYTAIENQVNKTNAAILGLQQNLEFDTITIRLKGMDAAGVQDLKNRLKDLGEEKADARPGKRGKRERERIKAEITEVQKLIRRGEQTNAAKKIRCLDTEITKQKELAAEHLKQAGIIKKGTEYDKEAI